MSLLTSQCIWGRLQDIMRWSSPRDQRTLFNFFLANAGSWSCRLCWRPSSFCSSNARGGKRNLCNSLTLFFADVLGLQQLRVLQHNRQDHRSDAGFFHLFSFFLWAVDIIGDVQPPDRHGSKVPRPKLNFPNWGESVMWTQIQNTCQFRLKRGLRKWKCQFATWRSSKPVSWWEKGLESKFSSTNTSSFRSTRWLCRRTSPTRASRPDPGSSRSRLSSSVSIPSSTDSTPCLSSSPLQSRWESLLCFNQNYLPFIPKVHEAWESGNWRDPWESLDK